MTLSNSSVTNNVYGGFTHDGVADGSKVTGTNSKVGGSIYGGQGTTGASSNTVDLDNVQVRVAYPAVILTAETLRIMR